MSQKRFVAIIVFVAPAISSIASAGEPGRWAHADLRFRTTVRRPTPYRSDAPRPVEVAVDLGKLAEGAGVDGRFQPGSARIVGRSSDGRLGDVPFAWRTEFDARAERPRAYLAWIVRPEQCPLGEYDVYFGTRSPEPSAPKHAPERLPPENLLANPGFEEMADGLPTGWSVSSRALVQLGRFGHTTGERSLAVVVDDGTPDDAGREVTVSQSIDVSAYSGQEMLFECDLLAERAAYGAPVSIELEQSQADGSRIPEYAVQPRWLSIELAQGQLVQFSERGRFSPEAATVNVRIRFRCSVGDADTRQTVAGPESYFTIWIDRLVVRPAERWPWPAATHGGFVEGAIPAAPVNRGFEFTGLRRLAFNGASEGTLASGRYNPNPKSVHWGLERGTLELWCRPKWSVDDGAEHVFFDSVAYGHRLQSRLGKLGAAGGNRLEFMIADAGGTLRSVRGHAALEAGRWHHVAATWDFPEARLQLFVDGQPVASEGPGQSAWPSSLVAVGGPKKTKGIGIMEDDTRSMPMQAFIGGDKACGEDDSAEAVFDEVRISDVVRYTDRFTPTREEFTTDAHTRALFHFENERHGVHDSDDRFVHGHLACELAPQLEQVPLEILGDDGKIERRTVRIAPPAVPELFEANRAENRLVVTRPFRRPPDPRRVEYRVREVERIVDGSDEGFTLPAEGDFEPWMQSVTFRHAEGSPARTTLLPRWRANENVVPFSVESIAETLAPGADADAEKAFEAFRYALAVSNYYDAHFCETLPSRHRPRVSYTLTKALNVYPFDQCGPLNHMLRKLFLASGISSNNASGTHHQFQQAFYQGDWRLFDLSPRKCWLNRDDATVASRRAFEDDLYLKLRQGDGVTSGIRGRRSRATFGSAERPHSMDFPLRPGEQVSICWHNEGRWFEMTGDRRPIPLAKIPPYFGNGAVVYRPLGKGEAEERENVVVETAPYGGSVVRAKDPAKPAALVYRARCPYIFSDLQVSGRCQSQKAGDVRLLLSFDEGKTWAEAWQNSKPQGPIALDLRDRVTARYAYRLKLELAGGSAASVTDLAVRSTFVVSPLSLPGTLALGENRIRFVGGPPTAPVKTVCRWIERHSSDLAVLPGAIGFYLDGDGNHRNLFVVAPAGPLPLKVAPVGWRLVGEVSLESVPRGWLVKPETRSVEVGGRGQPKTAEFLLTPTSAEEGEIHAFEVVIGEGGRKRRVPAQVLVADAPLVCEAEGADRVAGSVRPVARADLSDARAVHFSGEGSLDFKLTAPRSGKHALWLRARWEPESGTGVKLTLDGDARSVRAAAMIGFTDWTDPRRAHTKMFAHFGEQYGHWSWYRVPDVELTEGEHQLTVEAEAGAQFDVLVLLPQTPAMDRAAMNLFQNWNYAPWRNPW
ncbi:MAG: LamG domain-containing protein [Planctomycetota bacterium]|jgi:hypothetical protein